MSNHIKFQTDEHIPSAVITGLQRRNIDILSTPQAGLLGASDTGTRVAFHLSNDDSRGDE